MNAEQKSTTAHAARAIWWNIEILIRNIAAERGLDRDQLLHAVWLRATAASLRVRDRPHELVDDLWPIVEQWRDNRSLPNN
jgi:hypothetical protein